MIIADITKSTESFADERSPSKMKKGFETTKQHFVSFENQLIAIA